MNKIHKIHRLSWLIAKIILRCMVSKLSKKIKKDTTLRLKGIGTDIHPCNK